MIGRLSVGLDRTFGRWSYKIHVWLYRTTGGVIGHRSMMGPMLLLTAVGRKSGQSRTNPLLYMPYQGDYFVVGSNGGRPQPPAWLFNVEANPDVTIQVGRQTIPVHAIVLRGAARR